MAKAVWVHALVDVPEGVEVEVEGSKVKVRAPRASWRGTSPTPRE